MLNSGKKIRALHDKKKYHNSRVVRKKILKETKNHNPPPLQVKWSIPYGVQYICVLCLVFGFFLRLVYEFLWSVHVLLPLRYSLTNHRQAYEILQNVSVCRCLSCVENS